jgi:hypothetical protein
MSAMIRSGSPHWEFAQCRTYKLARLDWPIGAPNASNVRRSTKLLQSETKVKDAADQQVVAERDG